MFILNIYVIKKYRELEKQRAVDKDLDKLLEEIQENSEQIKELSEEMERSENSTVLSDKPEEAADFNLAALMSSLNVTDSTATTAATRAAAQPQRVMAVETA